MRNRPGSGPVGTGSGSGPRRPRVRKPLQTGRGVANGGSGPATSNRLAPIELMKRFVVIPAYKAAATVASVIDRLPGELWSDGGQAVIVNDGSPDDTGRVIDELAKQHAGRVVAVHHEKNRGYGGALKTGLAYAVEKGGEVMPVVHSDGQYAPELVLRLCQPIEAGLTGIVQGSRMRGGARSGEHPMPLSRYLPNRVLTCLENLTFGTSLAEFHSGYMVFSKSLLERVPYRALQNNYNFDAEMILLAHLAGVRTIEVPIPTRYDGETSSLNPIPYGLNVLKMMWRYTTGHYLRLLDLHEARQAEGGGKAVPAELRAVEG